MSVKTFSQKNRARCESPTGFNHKLSDWSMSDWICAITGEIGEAANIVKKLNRVRDGIAGNDPLTESPIQLHQALAYELADVYIYLDLAVQAAGFDLETIRDIKFAITSKKIGYVEEDETQ